MSVVSRDRLRLLHYRTTHEYPPTHFITFANTDFMRPTRILAEAQPFPFSTRRALTEHDLGEFATKHAAFLAQHTRGYGLWIWKPKIILDTLKTLPANDILVYCDAGMHLNTRGLRRYADYLELLETTHIVTFALNDAYKTQHYVKRDAINAYYPEFASQELAPYCYAGVMMLRNTPETVALVTDWLALCETYSFLDTSPSVATELPCYLGNDCDNGLFNLCLAKHKISRAVYPDETNLYTQDGQQFYGASREDWEHLAAFPFQCRRLRRA